MSSKLSGVMRAEEMGKTLAAAEDGPAPASPVVTTLQPQPQFHSQGHLLTGPFLKPCGSV